MHFYLGPSAKWWNLGDPFWEASSSVDRRGHQHSFCPVKPKSRRSVTVVVAGVRSFATHGHVQHRSRRSVVITLWFHFKRHPPFFCQLWDGRQKFVLHNSLSCWRVEDHVPGGCKKRYCYNICAHVQWGVISRTKNSVLFWNLLNILNWGNFRENIHGVFG